jgi:hypothetical protein
MKGRQAMTEGKIFRGIYKGREYTVQKEQIARYQGDTMGETKWVARCSGFNPYPQKTRKEAISRLEDQIDRADVQLPPEIEAVLKRWTEQIKPVALRLNPHDVVASAWLQSLKHDIAWFEGEFRRTYVRIEQHLARLKERASAAPEQARLEPLGTRPVAAP